MSSSLDSLEEREGPEAAGRPREPEVEEAFDRLVAEGGNLIGGTVLVTSIRLLQVPHRVAEERADH